MPKLTKQQREELKHLILNGIVHHFTTAEIQQYIQSKLNIQISIDYLKHFKTELKKDSKKELEYLAKDRFAFIHALFFERLEELKSYQKTLHSIVLNNPEKPEAQIKAISELKDITVKIANLYDILPTVVSSPGLPSISIVNNNNNDNDDNNNPTITSTCGPRQNYNGDYLKWCANNNPKHPDHCNCDKYQV
jgi:hypothetical protein